MAFLRKKVGLQGTWPGAFFLLLSPLLIILGMRWIVFEPFVIPSGSMQPNLLVHDHLIVKKYSYGIRLPFSEGWLYQYKQPQRGDVVVFKFPDNKKVFYIKRVVGLPGDRIKVHNGQITVNDQPWILYPQDVEPGLAPDQDDFHYYSEEIPASQASSREGPHRHYIRISAGNQHVDPVEKNFSVPEKSYFMMGDNRDESHDSRFWGFVPADLLIGEASWIWLSCDQMIETAPMICNPTTLRTTRMFKGIQ